MPDNDDTYGPLLDQLIGAQMALSVFMAQVSCELARGQDDPAKWARQFIKQIYARLDSNENKVRKPEDYDPFHEHARKMIDVLGGDLLAELNDDRS